LKAHKAAKGNLYTPAGHFVQPFKPGVLSTSKKADPFQPLATTLTLKMKVILSRYQAKSRNNFSDGKLRFFLV
jgi:hypothetical protein